MLLKLVKKTTQNDLQPLVVHADYQEMSFTKKLSIGETLEVDDQLGYQIMAQYPNMFENQSDYKTKTMHAEKK